MSYNSLDVFIRFIVRITTVLFVLYVLFIFMLFILSGDRTLFVSHAPDKSYKIIVKYSRGFPGPEYDICVYYKKKFEFSKHELFRTVINNGGPELNTDNYSISWDNQIATIRFKSALDYPSRGSSGKPETYVVDFANISRIRKYKKLPN